ncbi:MAG: discoidin domain-containing protein, partial [Gammaproteobacteria bacterium]|nr:discoidin domain-containing protein [Gammaproteobacteria bacterium]
SQFSDPQWIYVDLGSVYAISRVVLKWESAFGKTYEIQVSDDAMSWTTVFTEPNGNGGVDDITFSPASGRYVRMYGTQRGTAWGYSLFEFEVYGSGATPSWQTLPDSSQQRHESSLAVIGNRIVLLGGRGSRPVEIFDLQTGEWNTFSAPPITLHHFQAVTLEGLVYVIGAYTGRYPNEISVPNVYTYDPTLDQWNQGTLIPADRRRGSAGAVVHNNKIYIVGGIVGGHGEHADAKPWLDQYDPATNQWTILPDMPTARDHFGAAAVSGKIYAVAGRDSGISDSLDHTIGATSVYDIETLSWVELPVDSDIPTERAGVAVAANNGEIIVSGGEGFGQAWATVEAFDTNTSTWTTLPSMPTARHGMGAVVVGGEYYVSSGATSQGGGSQSTIFQKLPLGN